MNNNYKKLTNRINSELIDIRWVVQKIENGMIKAKASSDDLYLDGVALNLHSLYSGIERIFQLIAENIDKNIPKGKNWHKKLIDQMAREIYSVRPAVITEELVELLQDYRGFRHVVRNVYSYNFNQTKIEKLVKDLPKIFKLLSKNMLGFIEFLEQL